jgi:hypothetical protein
MGDHMLYLMFVPASTAAIDLLAISITKCTVSACASHTSPPDSVDSSGGSKLPQTPAQKQRWHPFLHAAVALHPTQLRLTLHSPTRATVWSSRLTVRPGCIEVGNIVAETT